MIIKSIKENDKENDSIENSIYDCKGGSITSNPRH